MNRMVEEESYIQERDRKRGREERGGKVRGEEDD